MTVPTRNCGSTNGRRTGLATGAPKRLSCLIKCYPANSTLQVDCLPAGSPKGAEAVAFFETVVKLFLTLPTYEWLSNQGITPSQTKTHTLASLTAAIKAEYGFTPSFDCDGDNLSGASYYFHLIGSVIDGTFIPIDAAEEGSCGSSDIKYLTKTGSPVTAPTAT